ncbi:hypothetical protein HZB93_01910 [Candidatus Falkowbacteria bacterium]|nr:hypothetical protein [Candidatus Falkowbacteria bacterium]
MNRHTRQAMEIIFSHLVNRLPLVHLPSDLDYLALVDPSLTTRCLICLVCGDLRAGGNAPIYIKVEPIMGQVGGDGGWLQIVSREWRRGG